MPTKQNKNIKIKLAARKTARTSGASSKIIRASLKRLNTSTPRAFGPVATIDTAPVAIGNSVRGTKTRTINTDRGVRVIGRDFMFTALGSGSITTWVTVGGTPITAACFTDSVIRSYMQMYQKFKVRSITAHYITSSPTSSTGDVLFYFQKNANSVYLNQTSSQLLPFVMSDDNTVLGPQWTNHSTRLELIPSEWKSTDYGMSADLNQYSFGNLFLLSKTTTTDSPGYVLFDYDIEFAELQVSPRLLTLPIGRIQYSFCNLGATSISATSGVTQIVAGVKGNDISGSASTLPSGWQNGDVYKCIFDVTNSNTGSWAFCNTNNLMTQLIDGAPNLTLAVSDGVTIYLVALSSTTAVFFASAENAFAMGAAGGITYGVTATVTWNLQCMLSLVGSVSVVNYKPNF